MLHSHERPLFAGLMISCPQQLAAALRASRTRRKDVEFDAHAMLPVQFYFLVRRSSSPRKGCHSGAAASIPAMTAMNVTAMQRKSTGAEKNTNMVASTLLAQIASVKRRPRVLGVGDQNQSPKCGALEPHTRQTPTDNEFTRPRGSVPSAGRSGDHPSHNRLGSWALLSRGLMTGSAPYE